MCGADSLERSCILKDAEGVSEKKLSGFLVISQAKLTERLVMLMSKVLFGKSSLLGFFKFFAFMHAIILLLTVCLQINFKRGKNYNDIHTIIGKNR